MTEKDRCPTLRRLRGMDRDGYLFHCHRGRIYRPGTWRPMMADERLPEADASEVWRCPKHGLLEPHRHQSEYGRGEPGEYGTCPIMEDEDTGCGRRMVRVDLLSDEVLRKVWAEVWDECPPGDYLPELRGMERVAETILAAFAVLYPSPVEGTGCND